MSSKKNTNEEFYTERTVYDQYFSVLLNPTDLIAASKQTSSYGSEKYFPWMAFAPRDKKDKKKREDLTATTFAVHIDVHHFTADEMEIHIKGNDCSVNAIHEDRDDEHGTVRRSFLRKFKLPDNVDLETAQSTISSDGVLTFQAKYKPAEAGEGAKTDGSTTVAADGSAETTTGTGGEEGGSVTPPEGEGSTTPAAEIASSEVPK